MTTHNTPFKWINDRNLGGNPQPISRVVSHDSNWFFYKLRNFKKN